MQVDESRPTLRQRLMAPLLAPLRRLAPPACEAVPAMDGPFMPNDLLDHCVPFGPALPGADGLVVGSDGALHVSAGNEVLRLSPDGQTLQALARFDSPAGGLALHPDGRLLVCVAGQGLAALAVDAGAPIQWLKAAEGRPLHGLTGVTAAPDGQIYLTEGSQRHPASRWTHDLLEKNRAGRLLRCGPALDQATVLRDGLAWPHGPALSADGLSLLLAESWRHRLSQVSLRPGGPADTPLLDKLPAYPGRLSRRAGGGFWLSLFAPRTHLLEFILQEDRYRQQMMSDIDPRHWVAPAMQTTGHCLEPMQFGSVKALGQSKPWAPPRSYGLVAQLDEAGEVVRTLHSRVGGLCHGITAACDTPRGLVVVSQGSGRLWLQEAA